MACLVVGVNIGRPDVPGDDSVDVGFLQDMIDHHDQGVAMAQLMLDSDAAPVVKGFAKEVVLLQRWDLGKMDAWLADWGKLRGDLDRTDVMGWMPGMPRSLTVAAMPGMASEEQLDQLEAATGPEKSRLFLTMMRDHHRGGLHMADYAATHAKTEKVHDLAELIAANQRKEVREYDLTRQQLGL